MSAETQQLPLVPLKWTEFMWSLEKLRHRPYSKKMQESDWFRINPLEMVLLGCQTLATGSAAKRDHGTLMLSMEYLGDEIHRRPRYWERAMSVLCTTAKREETPSVMVQRCVSGIIHCWSGVSHFPKLHPGLTVWAVTALQLVGFIENVKKRNISLALRNDLDMIIIKIHSYMASKDKLKQSLSSLLPWQQSLPITIPELFEAISKEIIETDKLSAEGLLLQLAVIKDTNFMDTSYIPEDIATAVVELVSQLKRDKKGIEVSLCLLLSLVLLVNDWVPPPKEESEEILTGDSEVLEDTDPTQISAPPMASLPVILFSKLASALKEWWEKAGPDANITVPLLQTICAILTAAPCSQSLPNVVTFVDSHLSVLMTYSTDGYLSDNPTAFFQKLLEFIASLSEQGIDPITAIQTNLPNLFGPVFGVRSHIVSCLILEYGYLSVCSQHKKALLGEGLHFLVRVWKLFPPLDLARAQTAASLRQLESLHICQEVLHDLITSLPITDAMADIEPVSTGMEGYDEGHIIPAASESTIEFPVELPVPVTDEERRQDKTERTQLLVNLLQLACAMVRKGDNTCFLYASTLPKLFSPSAQESTTQHFNRTKLSKFFGEDPPPPIGTIPWNVDKKPLAVQLLSLCVAAMENDMATPFQLCSIVLPKLVRNLDSMSFSDEEKLSVTLDILQIAQETMEAGHDISELVSHGLDLLSNLLLPSTSSSEIRDFIGQMTKHLVASGHTSLLFLIKNAFEYMKKSFPLEIPDIQGFFKTIIFRGRRNEIRSLFRVCRDPFGTDIYSTLRCNLYKFTNGQLSSRQLQALCEIIISAMDLQKQQQRCQRESTIAPEELSEEEMRDKEKKKVQEETVMTNLISPCLTVVESALKENRFKRDVWESVHSDLARVALFRTLFNDELASLSDLSSHQLKAVLNSKFPSEVLSSEETMALLSHCATRIEHMQIPRFSSLKALLIDVIKSYLVPELNEEQVILEVRENLIKNYIDSLPRNVEDKARLLSMGYSHQFWDQRLSFTVKTDGSHSLEENMRQTLLACYREFADIMKQMSITHVSVDGEMIKTVDLFDEELSLVELKGQRAVAVRAIDQRLGSSREGHFYERKVALLSKEDDIETDFEIQAKEPLKPKTFTVALNTKFFDCAKCCGGQIIGCYAPSGEHCERPLEVGFRIDSAFASIYNESGTEIENVELLLCDEGVYAFKAYTNGHPYDTSQVWSEFFVKLLQGPEPLVPAIIIPKFFPNQRTWDLLRRKVQPEMTGSMLTCRHDFSPSWRTYYDSRPEKVRCGIDIVLHPGFSLIDTSDPHGRPLLMRQRSRMAKDLAGLIFEDAMQHLLKNELLQPFKFLGKLMAQYVSVLIEDGEERPEIISQGFNYERWRKAADGPQKGQKMPSKAAPMTAMPILSKEDIVQQLVSFLGERVEAWCEEADLQDMCTHSHKQLLQLKRYLERRQLSRPSKLATKLRKLRKVLTRCMCVVPVARLSGAMQEEVMHWIFNNEDRVWRYRGGRDGHETLQQFLSFLGHGPISDKLQTIYPGVVVFCLPQPPVLGEEQMVELVQNFQVTNMVAYAVGEKVGYLTHQPSHIQPASWDQEGREGKESEDQEQGPSQAIERWQPTKPDCYEVVTAWVHPRYRGLNLGVQMYFDIVRQAPAKLIMCDMLRGSVERIIQSNFLLQFLQRVRLLNWIIWRRQDSYTVTMQTGAAEQFEQVVFRAWPMRLSLWVYDVFSGLLRWVGIREMASQPVRLR